MEDNIFDKVHEVDLEKTMKDSYIDYAMSVIASRALPDVRDGLKPVQRRVLYSMIELNNGPDKPHRKCARIVGDTMGKYHPHGDSSIYGALVNMAQEWSTRYPLVDGHGNFGSVDGDGAAAMRYTEARLSKISMEMLADINKDTVDFQPNFDETEREPVVLPSRYPNLLVNGTSGIAVGMATNIPPHNLREVVDAVVKIIDNIIEEQRETTMEEILDIVKGPDFPTGATILGRRGIEEAYRTGRGKIRVRAVTNIETLPNGKSRIIVTELPYLVNKARLISKIAELVRDKKIDGITDLNDHSSREGMRICIDLRKDANANVVLNLLYKHTQLQDTFGVNMLSLIPNNGSLEPKVLNLKQMLEYYLAHQEDVVIRRTKYDLNKARERAHILEGLLKALDNIDEVIRIIRGSRSVQVAKQELMDRFELTDVQAQAIVDMRLRALTGLEREKLEAEYAELEEKIRKFLAILADRNLLLRVVREEILAIADKYGDERRTAIEPVSGEVDIEDLIPEEECVLTYTNIGYIKRQPVDVYNLQKRGGKGVSGMKQREEDFVEDMFISSTHDNILFITNYGNMYKLKCYEVPEGSKQSRGTNIVNLLQLDEGERIAAMMKTSDFAENKYFICVTKYGKIKRTPLYDFRNVRKNGLRAITLAEGDEIAAAHLTEGDSSIIVATHLGMAIHFSEDKIRSMGRLAAGVRAIKLREDDYIVGAAKVYSDDMRILTVTDKGYGRLSALSDYRMQNRGGNGLKNYKIRDDRGYVCGIRSIQADDDVILISTDGVIIRIRANDLRVMRRTGLGVRVMKLSDEDRVVTFTRTEHDETADIEEVEQASDEEIAAAEAEAEAEVIEDEPETNEEE